nr:hypothetical protein [uncultured Gammaproteobacteria bacterium]
MKRMISLFAITIALAVSASAAPVKLIMHLASIPIIDGAGIYSSINFIQHGDLVATKALGVTSISLLAVNGGLGVLKMAGPDDWKPQVRHFHRIVGFVVTVAAVSMSVSASLDKGLDNNTGKIGRYVSYGYSALTVVPLVIFSF